MTAQADPNRPPTPSSSSSMDTPQRPLPALPTSSLPISTRRPTKSSRPPPNASTTMKSSLEPVMEGDGRLMRDVHSPPPGDVRRLGRKASGPELSKQKSQYFEDTFRSKYTSGPHDEGLLLPAVILAEVKTNVFVSPQFPRIAKFTTALTSHIDCRRIQLHHRPCKSPLSPIQPPSHPHCNFAPARRMSTFRRNIRSSIHRSRARTTIASTTSHESTQCCGAAGSYGGGDKGWPGKGIRKVRACTRGVQWMEGQHDCGG